MASQKAAGKQHGSKPLSKVRTNRNNQMYRGLNTENTRTERGILKMVDKQIDKGLRALNKKTKIANY